MPLPLSSEAFKKDLFYLLREVFEGPPADATGTAALDRDGNWRRTLDGLSAADASRSAFPGATTVAAQVVHTTFYLADLLRYLRPDGDRSVPADWPGSWSRTAVTEDEWSTVRAALFTEYEAVQRAVEAVEDWGTDIVGLTMAPLLHSAYHLGAVRQLVKALRAGPRDGGEL